MMERKKLDTLTMVEAFKGGKWNKVRLVFLFLVLLVIAGIVALNLILVRLVPHAGYQFPSWVFWLLLSGMNVTAAICLLFCYRGFRPDRR
jgi:fatty-acid desaturase